MSKPYEIVLVVDAETYWDSKEYTLSKMTTEEYVRDPRFKCHGFCFKTLGASGRAIWVPGPLLANYLKGIDWSKTAILAHNAAFDGAILAWHYGVKPAFIFDSLSMARALRGIEVGNSLMKLAEDFGLPPKGRAVHSTDGLRDLSDEVEAELADYCKHDVFLCEEVFARLVQGYPKKELRLIDMTLRMFLEPKLVLDKELLRKSLDEENTLLRDVLERLNVVEGDLASNEKFAELLRAMGVEPPIKRSKTTGKDAYAFAKNDALFQAIMDNGTEEVQLLCEARLRTKSTLLRTRAQRFVDMAERGAMPIPLSYYGAHTGRWQAMRGANVNVQNMKRGSFLKRAIMAPEGYTCVVGDLSQIEVRVLASMTNNQPLIEIFKSGDDPYSLFGRNMFGVPDLTKDTHPALRQSAKSALLGAGYNLGWASFAAQLLVGFLGAPPTRYDVAFAKQLGLTRNDIEAFSQDQYALDKMKDIPHSCSYAQLVVHCACAKVIIDRYRKSSPTVTNAWALAQEAIPATLIGGDEFDYACIRFKKGAIELPNGMHIRYPDLRARVERNEKTGKERVSYTYGDRFISLYGGKIVENYVQAVARCIIADAMLRISKEYPVVLTVHDEVVSIVPTEEAQEAERFVYEQLIVEPPYLKGVPLDAEVSYSRRYGDCK